MPELKPTAEQMQIVEAARRGANLVIQAGAGTGKTSTLKMVAGARRDQSLSVRGGIWRG